ncbi:MAG: hypothetical protein ACRDGA_13180 [Bacteroidota bacterium]
MKTRLILWLALFSLCSAALRAQESGLFQYFTLEVVQRNTVRIASSFRLGQPALGDRKHDFDSRKESMELSWVGGQESKKITVESEADTISQAFLWIQALNGAFVSGDDTVLLSGSWWQDLLLVVGGKNNGDTIQFFFSPTTTSKTERSCIVVTMLDR